MKDFGLNEDPEGIEGGVRSRVSRVSEVPIVRSVGAQMVKEEQEAFGTLAVVEC